MVASIVEKKIQIKNIDGPTGSEAEIRTTDFLKKIKLEVSEPLIKGISKPTLGSNGKFIVT